MSLKEIVEKGNSAVQVNSVDNWIACKDGFKMSVIAGPGAYCIPRPDWRPMEGEAVFGYEGPYTHVEVGYPSEQPEPWEGDDLWASHAEDGENPTGTVYGWVPIEMVASLIALHGGEL